MGFRLPRYWSPAPNTKPTSEATTKITGGRYRMGRARSACAGVTRGGHTRTKSKPANARGRLPFYPSKFGYTKGTTIAGTLHTTLARHVERADMPGIVALVACGDDVHVEAIGHKGFGDTEPIGRDAIFRIASITKPIAGAAAMLLIEDGALGLDDPVDRWLPD